MTAVFPDHEHDEESAGNSPAVPAIPLVEICAVFQAREFLEDRYYRSEEHGYNVGDTFTSEHWVAYHAARFRTSFEENAEAIQRACTQYCLNGACKVYELRRELGRKNGMCEEDLNECKMPKEELHALVEKNEFS